MSDDNGLVEQTTTEAVWNLASVSIAEIEAMTVGELKELSKISALPVTGKRGELIKQLKVKKIGRADRYAGPGQTKCCVCDAAVTVKGTTRATLDDGRILITRSVRCQGKHKHTYPLKEIVPARGQ